MNQFFNFPRFALLARSQWAEWRGAFFKTLLAWCMLNLLLFMLKAVVSDEKQFHFMQYGSQSLWAVSGLFFFGTLFSSFYFSDLAKTGASLTMLMRPASAFEKTLLGFVSICIVFPICFFASYSLVSMPAVNYAAVHFKPPPYYVGSNSALLTPDFTFYIPFLSPPNIEPHAPFPHYYANSTLIFLAYFCWQAIITACRMRFKTSPGWKTVLVLFIFAIFSISMSLLTGIDLMASIDYIALQKGYPYEPTRRGLLICWLVLVAPVFLLWCSAYLLFQERELGPS